MHFFTPSLSLTLPTTSLREIRVDRGVSWSIDAQSPTCAPRECAKEETAAVPHKIFASDRKTSMERVTASSDRLGPYSVLVLTGASNTNTSKALAPTHKVRKYRCKKKKKMYYQEREARLTSERGLLLHGKAWHGTAWAWAWAQLERTCAMPSFYS
ncbi:hypothetical protein LZ32DRAFT_197614 [Colletotrichum eremochloae]|nr:hypothetical protein LZ32DRAFT_197614 [Colletotrichum eremochloae]